ncbi:MAG: glutamate--cysteine ligase [Rhodospirillaceae bacterium]|jgi:glutamate--cysteine ligase|nr:glutamate--cysteine ligase [Rhodospirillaceae bacterium]
MSDENKNEIEDKAQLIAFLASGCKPEEQWKIGTEHEKFAFDPKTLRPLFYNGGKGIRAFLEGMERFDWMPVLENGKPIALVKEDHSSVTLEPGGQVELSGAPLDTIHQTCREVGLHLNQAKEIASELGISFMGMGYQPKWGLADIEWMPKGRYEIMRNNMLTKGDLGLHMMLATCTVQVNLDFKSEAHMTEMFRTSLAVQPVATALWASSPFRDGAKSGYLSYRSHIWTDTDPDRCGLLPFVFEDGFGFEHYVDYMLDVPMYFVYRNGKYIDASGQSFRDFMAGTLPALPGEKPTIKDWEDHLTTVFPEVRLKKYIEMRGADGGPWNRLCALPAFWVGLMYDAEAFAAVRALIKDWSYQEISSLRDNVPRTALSTEFRGGTVQDLALQLLAIAKGGLVRRGKLDSSGQDESTFLKPLHHIAETGVTPAEELLASFDGAWNGSVDPAFEELAY